MTTMLNNQIMYRTTVYARHLHTITNKTNPRDQRLTAIRFSAEHYPNYVVRPCTEILKDFEDDATIRLEAITVINELGSRQQVQSLDFVEAHETDTSIKDAISRTRINISEKDEPRNTNLVPSVIVTEEIEDSLTKLGEILDKDILALAKNPNEAKKIYKGIEGEAIPVLIQLMDDKETDHKLSIAAKVLLEHISSEVTTEELTDFFYGQKDVGLRSWAFCTLLEKGFEFSQSDLSSVAKNEDEALSIRLIAIAALSKLDEGKIFRVMLQSDDPLTRIVAISFAQAFKEQVGMAKPLLEEVNNALNDLDNIWNTGLDFQVKYGELSPEVAQQLRNKAPFSENVQFLQELMESSLKANEVLRRCMLIRSPEVKINI